MARTCPACEKPVEIDSAASCTHCGASMQGAVTVEPGGGRGFLRENWLWIVMPIVIAAIVIAVFLYVSDSGDGSDGFIYTID